MAAGGPLASIENPSATDGARARARQEVDPRQLVDTQFQRGSQDLDLNAVRTSPNTASSVSTPGSLHATTH